MKYTTEKVDVHISTIAPGDTVICLDGFERTVGNKDIKNDIFLGFTLFGDSYNLGTIPVKKVVYKPTGTL